MAIDQIAQSGLSSLKVIYYSAQLFSTDDVTEALETLSLNLPQSQAGDNSSALPMRDSDKKILLGFHGTAAKHVESLMRGIRISGDFTGTAGETCHGTGFYIASDYGTADVRAFAASGHDMSAERAVFAVYAPNEDTLRNMTTVDYIQLYRGRSNGRGRPTSYEAIFTRQNEVDNLILERVLDEDSLLATTQVDPGVFRKTRGQGTNSGARDKIGNTLEDSGSQTTHADLANGGDKASPIVSTRVNSGIFSATHELGSYRGAGDKTDKLIENSGSQITRGRPAKGSDEEIMLDNALLGALTILRAASENLNQGNFDEVSRDTLKYIFMDDKFEVDNPEYERMKAFYTSMFTKLKQYEPNRSNYNQVVFVKIPHSGSDIEGAKAMFYIDDPHERLIINTEGFRTQGTLNLLVHEISHRTPVPNFKGQPAIKGTKDFWYYVKHDEVVRMENRHEGRLAASEMIKNTNSYLQDYMTSTYLGFENIIPGDSMMEMPPEFEKKQEVLSWSTMANADSVALLAYVLAGDNPAPYHYPVNSNIQNTRQRRSGVVNARR